MWWLLGICVLVNAQDLYKVEGDFSDIAVYQDVQTLSITGIKNGKMLEQPTVAAHSYLTDFSEKDMLFQLEKNSYYWIAFNDGHMQVVCSDQHNEKDKLHILIDPGHGGKDDGAVSAHGLKEKHVTLSFSKKLQQYLQTHPLLHPTLTRSKDIHIDKYSRLEAVLASDPYLLFSVHADAYTSPHAAGVGLFCLDDSLGSMRSQAMVASHKTHDDWRLSSKDFANDILALLQGRYKLHAKKAQTLPLVVLRSPKHLSMLLELGFLSNPDEALLLSSENYLDGFAADLADALIENILKREGIAYVGRVE